MFALNRSATWVQAQPAFLVYKLSLAFSENTDRFCWYTIDLLSAMKYNELEIC